MKPPRRSAKRIKTEQRDGDQFVGRRVAKYFFDDGRSSGELTKFFGTVTRHLRPADDLPEHWRIQYDDGDSEDIDLEELLHAIALEEEQGMAKIKSDE